MLGRAGRSTANRTDRPVARRCRCADVTVKARLARLLRTDAPGTQQALYQSGVMVMIDDGRGIDQAGGTGWRCTFRQNA